MLPKINGHIHPIRLILPFLLFVVSLPVQAQQVGRKSFGKSNPFVLEELPEGELKAKIQTLNPKAKARAMEWLHNLDFHAMDAAKHMRVDDGGGIYIICPLDGCDGCDGDHHHHDQKQNTPASAPEAPPTGSTTSEIGSSEDPPVPAAAPVPIGSPPAYNSRPGSTKHIYLDFNGGIVSGKQWNTSYGVTSWDCRPYDKDGDPTTFSDSEQAEIRRIWERTAEDYSSFDVNITTDFFYDPENTSENRYTGSRNVVGWSMFTAGTDKNGVNLPHVSAGGIAYLNVWGRSDYFSTYQPAFSKDYGSANATEAGSHEMGHNLGLSHDGLGGASPAEYYGGHNAVTGVAPSWGPIMGTGYNRNVTQWSKASEYLDGSQTQDDLSIISTKIGYRTDDHGNTFGTASSLANGTVNRTGVIERTNDPDFFTFISGPGTITLNAAGYKCDTGTWGGNLDVLLELYDGAQNLLVSNNPADQVNASVSFTVTGGTYYLAVKPVGAGSPLASPRNGYTVYGSLGQYTLTGTIPDKQPEIAVEQPAGNGLTDGSATVNCGSVNLGNTSSPITFTIRNTGQASLSGLALSKSGSHGDEFTLGSLGATTLAPGATTTFTVTFTPGASGTRTALLQIASNDLDENPFDITLTGTGVPIGTLAVTEGDYLPSGNFSGPFSPGSKAYTLTNIGSTAINWTAGKNASWIDLSSPAAGSLNPGASTVVTVSLNDALNSFNIGSYTDTLTFTNTTNDNGSTTRAVNLTVNPIPVAITIGNLLQYFDGSEKPATITASPNVAYTVTYNGSPTVPVNAGSYNVVVNVTAPNHAGTASATLVIAYDITYNGNGNTTGTAPASQTKLLDTPLTLATNTGNLIKSGATFAGWNTAANGTGTDYPAGSTYSVNASVTLYAKWIAGGNGTWLPTTAGPFNWGDSANWSNGIVASGTDNTAFFTPNITIGQTATLDTARTIGNITFTDTSSSSHNLTISGTNSLTLSRTSGLPVVDVTQSGRTLVISAPITGIHGLQKNGPGTLELRNISNNFAGGIVLNGGTLSATTNAGSSHFGNNPVTVNADATIYTVNTNVNPTTTGITINNSSLLNLDTNGSQFTVNGNVTGTGARISIGSTSITGTKTINLNGISNTFTGTIEFRTPTNSTSSATLNLNSLADSAALGQGNIRFGVNGATGNTVNSHILNIGSGTLAPIVLGNRRIELAGTTNSLPNINNNSGQALAINSDLLFSGGSSKILNLGGTGAGPSTFVGQIGDSVTPTTGTTVLAASYATGATVIRLASVNGIEVGASISGPNIPAATTVTAVNSANNEVTLSAATTNSGSLGATVTVTGVIGNLSITKNGTGTWNLSHPANTFTGPIILNSTTSSAGILSFASAGGTNPIFFNQTTSTATLRYTGSGQTMSGLISAAALTSGTITLDASGTGPIAYSNPDSLKLVPTSSTIRKLILTGDNTGSNIFAGALTNNSGTSNAATLTKNGTGTWILTGANAHTGSTIVNAGKLFIDGDHSAATGTVTVAANATLGGIGNLGGNATLSSGARLEFDISTPSASHNKLELAETRTFTFSGASTLTITSPGGAAIGTYILLTAPGGIVGNAPATLNLPIGWAATVSKVGNDLVLNVTNAPAPSVPSLEVTPPDGFDASGLAGGPFTPGTRVYTLTNTGTTSMNWTASDNAVWLDLSPASGTLAGEASATVTATINETAKSLAEGLYPATITFTNTTNGNGNTTRAASLFVRPPATYTVGYDGNGNTGGTAPADQTKIENVNLTLVGPGTLERIGYTFSSWNTAANGSGTSYPASSTYSENAAVTLYAQWTPNTYTVTFDPNGGNTPSPSTKQVTFTSTYGTLATVTRAGFVFNGWFTESIGGTEVTAATTVGTADNHTLYAQWTAGNPEIAVARGATPIPIGTYDLITGATATTAASLTYTISNSGNFDLTLGSAAISGTSNCSVNIATQPAGTIASAGSSNLVLSVTPTNAGAWSFSISLPNDDADENPYVWTVYGVAQGSATATLTAIADTHLQEANTTTNYGTTPNTTFSIHNRNNNRRYGLLRFDLTGIPANSTVQSAALSLVKNNNVTGSVNLVAATTSWIESGTGGATWANMNANLGATSFGSADALASGTTTIALNSTGRTALQNWVNGSSTNHGFGLKTTNAGGPSNFIEFHTKENGTSGNHPKLAISYTTTPSVAEMNVTRGATTIADGGSDSIPASIPGSGTPLAYTIANLGNADLTLTTPIGVSGATNCAVVVTTQPSTSITPGNTSNLVVTVTPSTTGAWSANLSITNNDPNENPYNWTISGTASGGFLVSYNANNPTSGNPPANQLKLTGVPLTLASNAGNLARLGYTFSGWNTAADGSGTTYPEGATYTDNATLALYAKWTVNTYTVAFDSNGGSTPSLANKQVTFDAAYGSLATTTREGHTFTGWFTEPTGGTEITDATIVAIANNHTLFARWTPDTYTVTFDSNGGATPSPTTKDVTYGTPYGPLAATSREGHTFNGWFTEANGGTLVTEATPVAITANQTLHARWTANTYVVTFDPNGGEVPSPTTKDVTYGAPYGPLATTTREGHTFNGWFTDANGGTQITDTFTVAITANRTLHARWTANTYIVTFNANGGEAPSPSTKQVTFGSTFGDLATTTRSGYTFKGWFTEPAGGTQVSAATLVDEADDQTLYAQWTPVPVASFAITGIPAQVPVGIPVTGISITALDSNGQVATAFTGTVSFGGTAGITGTSANFVAGALAGVSITPNIAGTGLSFIVDDGAGHTGSTTFDVLSMYQLWAGENDLEGPDAPPDADSDKDGIPNIREYAFGMNPNAGNGGTITFSGNTVLASGNPALWRQVMPGNQMEFRAVFARRKDYQAAGLVYTMEFSANLGEWVTSHVAPTVIADQGNDDIDAVYVPYPSFIETSTGLEQPLFFRVGVGFAP